MRDQLSNSLIYDPPSGWRYGFPKEYLPLPGETLRETLLRDGYPQHEIDALGDHLFCRFWSREDEQSDCVPELREPSRELEPQA